MVRTLLILLIALAGYNPAFTQITLQSYGDIGVNNISNGAYAMLGVMPEYTLNQYKARAGFQMTFSSRAENIFSGYFVAASAIVMPDKFPLEIGGFYQWNPFSGQLRETNWGILLGHSTEHWDFNLGTNFRTYKFSKKAIEESGFPEGSDTKIRENWNFMYAVTYFINPSENRWNIGATICNFDHFLIEQETNPMVNIKFLYQTAPKTTLFAETWYKSAGLFNMRVNSFGFFFRAGVIWEIN
ncbi:MAG: hypothetical protein KAG99_08070 [Bacteroidales bacterium]|nr:hypothetical protein [Bacteroidales bacterium]